MGDNNNYCNIISNHLTLKSKKLIMIVGSIKENITLEKSFFAPGHQKISLDLD